LADVSGDTLVFEGDEVTLDGRRVEPRRAHTTLIFHKPRAVTSTLADPEGKRDLSGWLARMPRGVFPVGRLDRETTGLLLFTSDGDLASAVTRPEHGTQKAYWLWLNEVLGHGDPRLGALVAGVKLHDGWARAERVELECATGDYCSLELTLHEGRNRQVRRMCRALDLRLLHLHRRRVGPLTLTGLGPGEFREIEKSETESLWDAVGGRDLLRRRKLAALRRYAAKLSERGAPHERLEGWLASELGRLSSGRDSPVELASHGATRPESSHKRAREL
jgi:23S rRNA pseudouridine2605 synthase